MKRLLILTVVLTLFTISASSAEACGRLGLGFGGFGGGCQQFALNGCGQQFFQPAGFSRQFVQQPVIVRQPVVVRRQFLGRRGFFNRGFLGRGIGNVGGILRTVAGFSLLRSNPLAGALLLSDNNGNPATFEISESPLQAEAFVISESEGGEAFVLADEPAGDAFVLDEENATGEFFAHWKLDE